MNLERGGNEIWGGVGGKYNYYILYAYMNFLKIV